MSNVKKRFEIEQLEGKRMRKIAKPKTNDKGALLGGFDYEDTEVDAGWMVYLPSGASMHVWTQEEMERQGFLAPAGLVDMETGEEAEDRTPRSLKSRSEEKSNKNAKGVHHTT